MEESETPLDQTNDDIHEHAHEAKESWIGWVAMSTAVLAAIAAICVLLSGGHANKAMKTQVEAGKRWNERMQNDLKLTVRESESRLLKSLDKPVAKDSEEKIAKYSEKKKDLQEEAFKIEKEADEHFEQHEMYAKGVTLFQIAITVAAIAVLSKRKPFWFAGLAFGLVGLFFFGNGLVKDIPQWMHGEEKIGHEAPKEPGHEHAKEAAHEAAK